MSKIDAICSELNKKAKATFITRGLHTKKLARIPLTSAKVNHMFYGGIPRGCIVEFYGDGGGGKTTTSLDAVANAQLLFKQEFDDEVAELSALKNPTAEQKARLKLLEARGPLKIVFMDAEGTLDVQWAETLGVCLDDVYIITPDFQTAEELLQMAYDFIDSDEVGLFVLDSIGALYSEQEASKQIGEKTYCGISGPLTVFSRKVSRSLTRNRGTLICINQIREEIDSQYIKKKTPGGKAFKHFCSLRVEFRKGTYITAKGEPLSRACEEPAGNIVEVHLEKSKVFPMNRKEGSYTLKYLSGIDIVTDLIDIAVMYGVISKGGAWYSLVDPETGEILTDEATSTELKFQGKANLQQYLEESSDNIMWLTECLNRVNNMAE